MLSNFKSEHHEIDEFDEESGKHYNDMSILNMHDPDMSYVKSLLDILHPSRNEDYNKWRSVLCVLANTSPSYKPLAEYFSRKCPDGFDFTPDSFDALWESLVSKKGGGLSIGSLHYWAKVR